MYYNVSEVFIMRRPRINLILGKKHLVAAGLALVLAVGLYANFAIGSNVSSKSTSGDNYGDTRLVSNENENTSKSSDKKDSDIVTASANTEKVTDSSEEYFAKARIDKQASREEAKETLKSIYGGGDMTKDELAVVAQDAQQLTDLMEAENKIETTLKAQGFEDVLCYLSDNSANIIVKSQGLDTAQAAQIKSALLAEVEVAGENITIVEVQ
ncbi:MAG: SpoIIIAH-like family protein [Ruminiclostridium sp.]|nr:SpoIIIAH-like family protein [Ruminiclostridium sp.]